MKINLFCLFLGVFFNSNIYAQSGNFFKGPSTKVGYEKLGAIRSIAGIIDDNYYVVESDYGAAFDMNNNIKSSVAIFFTNTGKFKKRIFLNELVAESKKETNKVLFTDIVTWKDKLIGFYTYKANAKTFMSHAIICDQDGKMIKDFAIGEFEHNYVGPAGGILNARSKLSVSKSFHMEFTPDSSRLIILSSAPEDKANNIRFKLYKRGLEFDKDVVANLPLNKKKGALINFTINNDGIIYLVGRTENNKSEKKESNAGDYSYFFYSVNTMQENEVKAQELDVPGKAISNVTVGLTAKGTPICVGFYNNPEAKKANDQLHGAFTIIPMYGNMSRAQVNTKAIPDSIIIDSKSAKALKKGEGLDELISILKMEPKPGGGLVAFGRYDVVAATVRGTTGAMNSFSEASSRPTVLFIDDSGKIQWDAYASFSGSNKELATRSGRLEFLVNNKSATAFYYGRTEEGKFWGIYTITMNELGIGKRTLHTKGDQTEIYDIVENSFLPIGKGEYIGLTYAGDNRGSDRIAIIKIANL